MKGAFALLDIQSVMQEQEQFSNEYIKECLWKMHYRGIKPVYISQRATSDKLKWLENNGISPYNYHFREDIVGLLISFLEWFSPNWEIKEIAGYLRVIDADRGMDEISKERGWIGYIEMAKVLYFTRDEAKRKIISDHYLCNHCVQVCKSLKEAAAGMDIPLEAFDAETRALFLPKKEE